jgi:transposase InsO family protein
MRNDEQEMKERLISEFRYGVIAELLNPYLSDEQRQRLIKEKAQREYEVPYSSKHMITEATIRRWLRAYKLHGRNGLLPRRRRDCGKPKSFTEAEQSALTTYLEAHPEVPARTALRILQAAGTITSNISQSALSRFVIANGLTKEELKRVKREERNLKFEFYKPLECVQADCMHAFSVPDSHGKKRKAILLAFIDDATRRILYSCFSFSEHSYEFEKGIKHIVKTHGRIGCLYCDNGSTFVSDQTKRILSIIAVPLFHSRPGKPAGRGKIVMRTHRYSTLFSLDMPDVFSSSLSFLPEVSSQLKEDYICA